MIHSFRRWRAHDIVSYITDCEQNVCTVILNSSVHNDETFYCIAKNFEEGYLLVTQIIRLADLFVTHCCQIISSTVVRRVGSWFVCVSCWRIGCFSAIFFSIRWPPSPIGAMPTNKNVFFFFLKFFHNQSVPCETKFFSSLQWIRLRVANPSELVQLTQFQKNKSRITTTAVFLCWPASVSWLVSRRGQHRVADLSLQPGHARGL